MMETPKEDDDRWTREVELSLPYSTSPSLPENAVPRTRIRIRLEVEGGDLPEGSSAVVQTQWLDLQGLGSLELLSWARREELEGYDDYVKRIALAKLSHKEYQLVMPPCAPTDPQQPVFLVTWEDPNNNESGVVASDG